MTPKILLNKQIEIKREPCLNNKIVKSTKHLKTKSLNNSNLINLQNKSSNQIPKINNNHDLLEFERPSIINMQINTEREYVPVLLS